MSEADYATPRRELAGTIARAGGGAGTFGVCELIVPPGQRFLFRSCEFSEPTRIVVGNDTQIASGSTGQQVSLFNPPGIALLGLNGLRADIGILGMLVNDADDLHIGLDWVIDFGQRISFLSQTEDALYVVGIHGKLMPTSSVTDARMGT